MNLRAGYLTAVPQSKRYSQLFQSWSFSEGTVRRAFERVYQKDAEYVLFQTIADKEAVSTLEKYIAFRDTMESPWRVREIQEGDNPVYVPGARNAGNGLRFSNRLMDSYLHAVETLADKEIGSEHYAHYPMVSTNGVHSHDRDPKAIYWPQVFLVNAKEEEKLKDIIDTLSESEKSFEVLEAHESPQFYQMAEIETLRNLGLTPLTRLPQEIRAGAEELGQYIDFLTQMTETFQWRGPVTNVD